MPCLLILSLWITIAGSAEAKTLEVDASGGGAYSSIQDAIDASAPGDTVLVRPGRYIETLSIIGDALDPQERHLVSSDGPLATVIDGNGVGPVVHCIGLSSESSIRGFTITGGVAPVVGGGIYLATNASPLIADNIIVGNRAEATGGVPDVSLTSIASGKPLLCEPVPGCGGGIYAYLQCRPLIRDNTIRDNEAVRDGGGITFWDHADARLEGNRIYRNVAGRHGGGVYVGCNAMPILERNIMAWNKALSGGGVFLDGIEADAGVLRNTLYMNSASGGTSGVQCRGPCRPQIHANLICLAGTGGVSCDLDTQATVTCNVVWAPGRDDFEEGDFDADCFPFGQYTDGDNAVMEVLFCGAPAGDFRPCSFPLTAECGLVGATDEACAPGACGTIKGSWGILKAIYRDP